MVMKINFFRKMSKGRKILIATLYSEGNYHRRQDNDRKGIIW